MKKFTKAEMKRVKALSKKFGNSVESIARAKWNADADEYNQWDDLGQDEKDELIANAGAHTRSEAE